MTTETPHEQAARIRTLARTDLEVWMGVRPNEEDPRPASVLPMTVGDIDMQSIRAWERGYRAAKRETEGEGPGLTAESEQARWVRYAADCAEHVLPLTDYTRPQAEAAIAAARAWVDDPCVRTRDAAMAATVVAMNASRVGWRAWANGGDRSLRSAAEAVGAAGNAARSAWSVRLTTEEAKDAGEAAVAAAGDAKYSRSAKSAAEAAEREWQDGRRRYYRLPEEA